MTRHLNKVAIRFKTSIIYRLKEGLVFQGNYPLNLIKSCL